MTAVDVEPGDQGRKDARILEKVERILWRDCQEEVPHT
jgi:hypothetical protein